MKRIKKFFKNLPRRISLTKRQQFVLVTLILTGGLITTQLFSVGLDLRHLAILSVSAYILSWIALREDLTKWEFITILTLPTFYTASIYLFYLLLPTRWLTRLPIACLYALGMYAILLTENIFNVAVERNIQLSRAAHSVGFLLTLVTVFFMVDTVISLHQPFYINALLGWLIIMPLSLQALWSMELTDTISKSVWLGTVVISLIISQLMLVLSFWPIKTTLSALLITTVFYTLTGLTQQFLIDRLFHKTIREYLLVLIIVLSIVLITTGWGRGYLM